jgi:NADPH:quinone reductase-like Zn-dependent oxidoreductase
MRAVYVEEVGVPATVLHGHRPVPRPGRRQVLIAVHAAGVNPRDHQLAEDRYAFRRLSGRLPTILGSDVSGVVVERGRDVTGFEVGDEVLAMQTTLGGMGGFAEYVAVHESAVARKPSALGHAEAAALPVAGLTAWQALADLGPLDGARVTVVGATGGVGHLAVQLARGRGASVTAVCGPEKADVATSLGASRVVDYTSQQLGGVLDAPQDLVLDTVGTGDLRAYRNVLAFGGRHVTTVPSARACADWARSALVPRRAGLPRSRLVLVQPKGRQLAHLAGLAASDDLDVLIHRQFPLAEAARALELSKRGHVTGKIVLTIT